MMFGGRQAGRQMDRHNYRAYSTHIHILDNSSCRCILFLLFVLPLHTGPVVVQAEDHLHADQCPEYTEMIDGHAVAPETIWGRYVRVSPRRRDTKAYSWS